MHYGPSFLSNGERERAEPILYMHTPNSRQLSSLKRNVDSWITPFDVHQTIKYIILTKKSFNSDAIGTSLVQYLGESRKFCYQAPGVPKQFCSLLRPGMNSKLSVHKSCTFMQEPPSASSFYADIPRYYHILLLNFAFFACISIFSSFFL